MSILRFALLGLGAGAIYGLLAQGLVILHRGAAVLNLAQGAMAMAGAFAFFELRDQAGVPGVPALIGAALACALLGLAIHAVVFRRLSTSSPLSRLIASLGVLLVLQAAASLRYGVELRLLEPLVARGSWQLTDGLSLGKDRSLVFVVGVLVTCALWFLYHRTRLGRLTTAVAEDPTVASALGHSPDAVSGVNWVLASGVAGLAGALVAPIVGLQPSQLSQLVVPALAAAVVSGFVSFPLTFAAGVGIGVIEAEVLWLTSQADPGSVWASPGWARAVPLLAIAVLLSIRGATLPGRGEVQPRLPAVVPPTSGVGRVVVAAVVAVGMVNLLPASWVLPLMVTAVLAVLALSVVTVTGFAGQLSLATYGLAGLAALVAGRAAQDHGVGFLGALALGAAAAGLAGVVIGLPALRTRGPNLAIITLGFGAVIDSLVLNNVLISGGVNGLSIGDRSIFGWDIDRTRHLGRYATVVVVALALVMIAVGNLRRSPTGRRLLAVRNNERAAASLGVRVAAVKLYAFALSAVIAGIGGVLLTFQTGTVVLEGRFTIFASITLVGLVVVGSVGYPSGALLGATLAAGAIAARVVESFISFDRYVALVGGLSVLGVVLLYPDGLAAATGRKVAMARALLAHLRRAHRPPPSAPSPPPPPPSSPASAAPGGPDTATSETAAVRAVAVPSQELELVDLRVAYGGVVALDRVSLTVAPGEIVGLIGPNGAGKTTLIDAAAGLIRSTGTVRLGQLDLSSAPPHRRAARGMGRTFQAVELFDDLTVAENLSIGLPRRPGDSVLDLIAPPRRVLDDAGHAVAAPLGLTEELARRPMQLDFGRRRLVGIARAVVMAPSVLLLDEPGAGLDTGEVVELADLVKRLARDRGMGILLVEHNLDMVLDVCDRVAVLDGGRLIACGPPEEVAADPRVIAAYIGAAAPAGGRR